LRKSNNNVPKSAEPRDKINVNRKKDESFNNKTSGLMFSISEKKRLTLISSGYSANSSIA